MSEPRESAYFIVVAPLSKYPGVILSVFCFLLCLNPCACEYCIVGIPVSTFFFLFCLFVCSVLSCLFVRVFCYVFGFVLFMVVCCIAIVLYGFSFLIVLLCCCYVVVVLCLCVSCLVFVCYEW